MMNSATAAAAATAASTKILDLLIIGGGLSGVMVAHDYHHRDGGSSSSQHQPQPSWKLLEARSVLGGRLANDDQGHLIDLGGAWVWPHHQPNLRHLLPQLGVETFEQPDDPSSTRIEGGAVKIVQALSKDLPSDNILLNAPVTKCTLVESSEDGDSCSESYIQVETTNASSNGGSTSTIFKAKKVAIAIPPSLISKHITFEPPLSAAKQQAMERHHTWMAGVTKISLVYPTAFWRKKSRNGEDLRTNMGLPSHLGPAFQVYDACTKDGSVAAITFFALAKNEIDDNDLAKQVANQLAQVWEYLDYDHEIVDQLQNGYTNVHVKRWPLESYISEDDQPQQIHPHPHPVGALSKNEWDGKLLFAGSEADLESPGVMEGAIGAALRVLRDIP